MQEIGHPGIDFPSNRSSKFDVEVFVPSLLKHPITSKFRLLPLEHRFYFKREGIDGTFGLEPGDRCSSQTQLRP
jgi:hypothetical protein